jgi:hypothetical protein
MLAAIQLRIFLSSCLLSKNFEMKIHETVILPIVLHGCGTWFLTLREEHRLRVFENRMLRRMFGPKREEVEGGWRRLHNEELCNLYNSPNIIGVIKSRRVRWVGQNWAGKPEGKRPLGRHNCRWEDSCGLNSSGSG